MAAEFPSRRDQLIFLINNYDMMLSVLMVSAAFTSVPSCDSQDRPVVGFYLSLFNPCVMMVLPSLVQERAADDSKEVEGFQQLLLARTQVINTGEFWEI